MKQYIYDAINKVNVCLLVIFDNIYIFCGIYKVLKQTLSQKYLLEKIW